MNDACPPAPVCVRSKHGLLSAKPQPLARALSSCHSKYHSGRDSLNIPSACKSDSVRVSLNRRQAVGRYKYSVVGRFSKTYAYFIPTTPWHILHCLNEWHWISDFLEQRYTSTLVLASIVSKIRSQYGHSTSLVRGILRLPSFLKATCE